MTSPFATFEEFSNAKGPIYTFANNPTMIGILLILSLLITIYFVYASFHLKSETSPSNTPAALGLLLVAGVASLLSALIHPPAKDGDVTASRRTPIATRMEASSWQPLALLGLMGLGRTKVSRRGGRSPKSRRSSRRSIVR